MDASRPLSLYVHVPYCASKCLYCAFNSRAGWKSEQLRFYVDALLLELGSLEEGRALALETVYVGGGTPTVLPAQELDRLLGAIAARVHGGGIREWTVEANPGTLDAERIDALTRHPVSRVSMGVQSFDPRRLELMGRRHTPEDVESTVADLRRATPFHLNLDLIYGLPGQDLPAWMDDLERLLALGPDHVSLYELQYEEGTAFHKARDQGRLRESEEELILRMHGEARRRLARGGFHMYEISNYARPGRESLHNLRYWRNQPYFGIGAGAYGRVGSLRHRNENDPSRYVSLITSGKGAHVERDQLGPREDYVETLSSGLRTSEGVDLLDLRRRTGIDPSSVHGEGIRLLVKRGLATVRQHRLRLEPAGLWILDEVMHIFLELPDRALSAGV